MQELFINRIKLYRSLFATALDLISILDFSCVNVYNINIFENFTLNM